jgi:hypothetical protein
LLWRPYRHSLRKYELKKKVWQNEEGKLEVPIGFCLGNFQLLSPSFILSLSNMSMPLNIEYKSLLKRTLNMHLFIYIYKLKDWKHLFLISQKIGLKHLSSRRKTKRVKKRTEGLKQKESIPMLVDNNLSIRLQQTINQSINTSKW